MFIDAVTAPQEVCNFYKKIVSFVHATQIGGKLIVFNLYVLFFVRSRRCQL